MFFCEWFFTLWIEISPYILFWTDSKYYHGNVLSWLKIWAPADTLLNTTKLLASCLSMSIDGWSKLKITFYCLFPRELGSKPNVDEEHKTSGTKQAKRIKVRQETSGWTVYATKLCWCRPRNKPLLAEKFRIESRGWTFDTSDTRLRLIFEKLQHYLIFQTILILNVDISINLTEK